MTVLKNLVLLSCLIFSGTVLPQKNAAPDLSWTYIDLENMDLTFENLSTSNGDEDGDGYQLSGQTLLGADYLFYGSYRSVESSFDEPLPIIYPTGCILGAGTINVLFEREELRLAVGSKHEITNRMAVFSRVGYLRAKVESIVSGSNSGTPLSINLSDSDDGYFLTTGIRGKIANRIELFALGTYEDIFNSTDTQYQAGVRFDVSGNFELGAAYRDEKQFNGYGFTGRYTF